jgi:Flp pilus assembly protein TadG
MKPLSRSSHGVKERGSATVEFAVVLPFILIFLFGIVEMGRVLSVSHALAASAREGARAAVLPGSSNVSVQNVVQDSLSRLGLAYDAIEFVPSDVSLADRRDPVTVRVRINYESIAWVAGFFPVFSGTQLEGVAVMRKEGFG